MSGKSEIGRELKIEELVVKTVIVLHKEGRPYATMWVVRIDPPYVWFHAGVTNTTFIAQGRDDGSLQDDSGMTIKVYEYLGEV